MDGDRAMMESLMAFKRAGCDGVLTYFAPAVARAHSWLTADARVSLPCAVIARDSMIRRILRSSRGRGKPAAIVRQRTGRTMNNFTRRGFTLGALAGAGTLAACGNGVGSRTAPTYRRARRCHAELPVFQLPQHPQSGREIHRHAGHAADDRGRFFRRRRLRTRRAAHQ